MYRCGIGSSCDRSPTTLLSWLRTTTAATQQAALLCGGVAGSVHRHLGRFSSDEHPGYQHTKQLWTTEAHYAEILSQDTAIIIHLRRLLGDDRDASAADAGNADH